MQRALQTENFYKSLHMLQAGKLLRDENIDENSPFEDYSIYMYRQNAPEFKDRVKELEQKLLHPVRRCLSCVMIVMCYKVLCSSCQIAFLTLNNNAQSIEISR